MDIKYVKDNAGNNFFPLVHEKGVVDDNGTTLESKLQSKQDAISDLSTIRSGASAGATAYQKPGTGIPPTDLASAVQTSLGKADTAIQSVTVGTTTTGAAGSSASVTNTGTATEPVLSFTIPQGAQGIQGIQGPQGERGPQGNTGVQVDSVASIIHSIDPTATYAAADVAGADAVQDVLSEVTELAGQLNNVASLNSLVFGNNLNKQRRNALSSTIQKLRLDTLNYTILGDSITDTWDGRGGAGGGASDAAHGYPQIVHRWLKEKYGNNIQFTNNGKGGDTTANALSAFDTIITPYNYDLVGLALGTNDWNVQTSLATFESTYRQLIAKVIDDTNAEYFIIGIGYFGTWGPTKTIREDKYNDVLRKLAKEFGVPYVDVYNAMKSNVDMGNDTLSDITYTPDPVHPNDSGHLIWAAETFKIFD